MRESAATLSEGTRSATDEASDRLFLSSDEHFSATRRNNFLKKVMESGFLVLLIKLGSGPGEFTQEEINSLDRVFMETEVFRTFGLDHHPLPVRVKREGKRAIIGKGIIVSKDLYGPSPDQQRDM